MDISGRQNFLLICMDQFQTSKFGVRKMTQSGYFIRNLQMCIQNASLIALRAFTRRMSDAASDGVVNAQGQIHGVDNLFVASSSNLVTSSQANSTFMIVAFALRMIDHIRDGRLLR